MNALERTEKLKAKAKELGFELSGVTPAQPPNHYSDFLNWLSKGYAGEMGYLDRRKEERGDPQKVLPGARAIFCVALSYNPTPQHYPLLEKNPVSCYAWGQDYHGVVGEKLEQLKSYLLSELDAVAQVKTYVDTGPLLEKQFAAAAGLGWIGKNTLLLNKKYGSFLFLGELLTTTELVFDAPVDNLCRTCTACMDACPVGALEEPGLLNATKCISYLTLEHRSNLPVGAELHGYLAGCDLCQTACPYNANAPQGHVSEFQPRPEILNLTIEQARTFSKEDFLRFTENSALERIKYPMWQRNTQQS